MRVGCVYVFICISAVCVRFSSYHPSDSDKCVRSTWRSPVALRYPERAATHLGLKMPEFLRSATCNSESWGCQNINQSIIMHHLCSHFYYRASCIVVHCWELCCWEKLPEALVRLRMKVSPIQFWPKNNQGTVIRANVFGMSSSEMKTA